MTEKPWWSIPVLSVVLAFVGVLLAQGVAVWLDQRRSRREYRQQWLERRRDLYSSFMREFRAEFERVVTEIAQGKRLTELDVHLDDTLFEIELVSSEEVVQGSRELMRQLHSAMRVLQRDEVQHELRMSAIPLMGQAMEEFRDVVRVELGITTKPGPLRRGRLQIESWWWHARHRVQQRSTATGAANRDDD